jgi:hypothetical protein
MNSTRNYLFSRLRSATALAAVAALLAGTGCSFSKSSKSSSKSISSPFVSSSKSSQSDESKYRAEVEEYAAASVRAGGSGADVFQKGISKLAEQRGISDWESSPNTWQSVGRGLAKSELSEAEALAFAMSWSDGDDAQMALMREAFEKAR